MPRNACACRAVRKRWTDITLARNALAGSKSGGRRGRSAVVFSCAAECAAGCVAGCASNLPGDRRLTCILPADSTVSLNRDVEADALHRKTGCVMP